MRSLLGRFRRPISRSQLEKIGTMVLDGDGSTLSLDFTSMSSLDSRFTFTRSSTTSTYINSSGLVTTAGTNVPRFDYDPTTLAPRGLLIEGSATNLLKYSQGLFTNWLSAGTVGAVTTGITSPSGDSSAVSLNLNTAGNNGYYTNNTLMGYTNTVGATYTFSIWVRATGSTTNLNIRFGDSAVGYSANIPITTSWQRLQYSYVAVSASGPVIASATGTATGVVELWGAQLEAGSGASSYIPTGASQVQRAVDQMTMANIAALNFNQSGGTVFMQVEGNPRDRDTFPYFAAFEQSPSGRGWAFLRLNNTSGGVLRMLGTAFNTSLTTGIASSNHTRPSGRFKFATTLEPTVARMTYVIAGGSALVDTASAFTLPTIGSLKFNNTTETAATDFTSVWISQLKYWPTVLTNAQLQAITA